VTRSPAAATWLARLSFITCCVLAGALAIEAYARLNHLDRRRARAIAVGGRQTAASHFQLTPADWDLPYLPRVFDLDEDRLVTAWGTCRFDHPGPTVLVLGDSTTRQASGGGPVDSTPTGEAARTWPGRLAGLLPPEIQLCVVAEDGYHPADQVVLLRKLAPLLRPALVVVLLCANDLLDKVEWVGVAQDGWVVVYEAPTTVPVFRPAWNPWLWENSEAYRFASWQLALRFGQAYELEVGSATWYARASLAALQAEAPKLVMAYLPMLDDAHEDDLRARRRLVAWQVPHKVLELQPPWKPLRREAGDRMHLSDHAHGLVAEQMGPAILAALSSSPSGVR
jgi:hypothetical protein